MCNLCNGTHVIREVPMPGVMVTRPCPKCNVAYRKRMGYEPAKKEVTTNA